MYLIELNEKQLNTLLKALDIYSRLGCGQLDTLLDPYNSPLPIHDKECAKESLKNLKNCSFKNLDYNASIGIFSEDAPEESKIAYDIIQVARNVKAWSKNPEGGITVDFDKPWQASKEPMPKIKRG